MSKNYEDTVKNMIVSIGIAFLGLSLLAVAVMGILGIVKKEPRELQQKSVQESYAGCYICSGGISIRYYGIDSYLLRKKAESVYGCYVVGLADRCISSKEIKL